MNDHLSDYGQDLENEEKEMFRKFVSDFFFIDDDGIVCERYNELYEINNEMPKFCKMIKKYITEDWTKDGEIC